MLYIMRHGRTDWNVDYKVQGRTDIPLNEEGIQMAQKARGKIQKIPFDICYSSPLIRAKKTAEIVLEGTDCPIVEDERLMEMSFGICEGDSHIFRNPNHPLFKLFKDPVNYITVEGGESFDDVSNRCKSFLKEVIAPELAVDKNILIVAHGALNCCMIGQIRRTPLEHFWDNMTENCELVELGNRI
ncbi:MAG: histidine phosphatase family protein [Lachnospiraceae bacterium]|nr:histidine phosphatase family protein [Lachnospiraceae bacterium]